MITTQDLQGIIALAVQNNKPGVIQAMNATGNSVASTISDDDLLQSVWNVFNANGLNALKNVLSKVTLNKAMLSADQQNALITKFGLTKNTAAKCSFTSPLDCLTGPVNYVGDLLGGHSSTTVAPTVTNLTPSLTSSQIMWIAGISIVSIVILLFAFKKYF